MPSKTFRVKMDDGQDFSFDWDVEKSGRPTKKIVKSLYEKSKEPKEEESVWNKLNKSLLPDVPPIPEDQGILARAANWGYKNLAQPAVTPIGGVAGLGALSRVGRIALGIAGTASSVAALPGEVSEAIDDPSLENVLDVGLVGTGAASLPLMYKAGLLSKKKPKSVISETTNPKSLIEEVKVNLPEVEPVEPSFEKLSVKIPKSINPLLDVPADISHKKPIDLPLGIDKLNLPKPEPPVRLPYTTDERGFTLLPGPKDKALPDISDIVIGDNKVFLPNRKELNSIDVGKELIKSKRKTVIKPGTYGIKPSPIDPTGSGLPVPDSLRAPSTNQTWIDNALPAVLRERIRGVNSGIDINDIIAPVDNIPELDTTTKKPAPKIKSTNTNVTNKQLNSKPTKPFVGSGIEKEKSNINEIDINPTSLLNEEVPVKDPNPALDKAAKTDPLLADAVRKVQATRLRNLKTEVIDPLFKSGSAVLEDLGDSGKEAALLLKRTRAEGSIEAGERTVQAKALIDKLSDDDFNTVVDILEGKVKTDRGDLNEAALGIKGILDELGSNAEQVGMLMRNPTGDVIPFKKMDNYFPHMFEDGFFSKNRESIMNQLIANGMGPKEAELVLKNAVETGPHMISPQHMRSLGLEGYRRDKGALYKHIDSMSNRIAEVRNLGANDIGDPASPLSKLVINSTDPERATSIINQQLGRTKRDGAMQDFVHRVNTVEAAAKLPLFAVSNMSQAAAPLMRSSAKSFVKGVIDTITKKDKNFSEESGALQSVLRNTLHEIGGDNGISKWYGMSKSEKFNRALSANTGKYEVEASFKKLKSDPTDKVARNRLKDLLLEDVDTVLKQDSLTDRQKKMAGFRMSEITQGITDPMDLPEIWNSHPLMKIPTMFKRFAFQQTKIIRDAIRENPKRNIALAGALYAAMGEAVGDTKAAISGTISGEGAGEAIAKRGSGFDRLERNIADGFAFGILTSLYDALDPEAPPGSKYEWLVGPAIADTANLASAGRKAAKDSEIKPLAKEAIGKLPMGYALKKSIFGSDKKKNKKRIGAF